MAGSDDLLRNVDTGDPIEHDQWNLLVAGQKRISMMPGMYVDGNGVYQRPVPQDSASETVTYQLTSNLDAGTLTSPTSATAKKLIRSTAGNGSYTVDATEVTIKSFKGHFGLKGEYIEVEEWSSDNGTVYEAVSSGKDHHKVTLGGSLAYNGSCPASRLINGQTATITLHDAYLKSGDSVANGTTGVNAQYDVDDKQWMAVNARCS